MPTPEIVPLDFLTLPAPPIFLYNTVKKKRVDNPVLLETSPFNFGFDESANDSVVNLTAFGGSTRTMSNDESGVIDIRTLSSVATSFEYTVNIKCSRMSDNLNNKALHAKTIFGTQGRPFRLPYPIVLPRTQSLIFSLSDLSGSSNDVRLTCQGFKYYFDAEKLIYANLPLHTKVSSFFYTTDVPVTLASLASDVAYIKLDSHDFIIYGITAHSTGAFLYKMSDVNLGRAFQNGYVHSSHLGTAEYQNNWEQRILIKKNTQLKFDLKNLTSSNNNIYLTLFGVTIYE